MNHAALFSLIFAGFLFGCQPEDADAAAASVDVSAGSESDAGSSDDGARDATEGARNDLPAYEPPPLEDLAQYVDPFIGTDGSGNVIPGALVPHGVVRASPVTNA
jgi:hypothetical protein